MRVDMKNILPDIKLSICMPTYNRARFIGEAIQSVICQAGNGIEIVIVDGASTDNTEEVVRGYKEKFSNLVYYRGEKKMGVDRDMAKSIELARGEYCWLLSDDDMLVPGSIERILKEIESGDEIYLCNVTTCDFSMKPYAQRFWLSREVNDRVFNLHDNSEFIDYCNKANSIGALFSYMSSIVLRRDEWNKTGFDLDFDGTAYALASTLISFVKKECRLKYIRDSFVLWRNDNESFQDEGGLVKRFLLDFDGYLKLADKYLTVAPKAKDAFLRVMTREHPWYTIIHVSSLIDSSESWDQFRAKLLSFGYNSRMVAFCRVLGKFKKIISWGVFIKRKIVKNHWVRKVDAMIFRSQIRQCR